MIFPVRGVTHDLGDADAADPTSHAGQRLIEAEPDRLTTRRRARPIRDEAASYAATALRPVWLTAVSLGTYAALLAADRDLPAIWHTPLLIEPAIGEALRRGTAPFLLVGGSADQLWDGELARKLTPHLLEVSGANHGMYVDGPLARSVQVLGRVITAIEHFLDEVVWLT